MPLRLVGEDYSVVQGLDNQGWLKAITRNSSDPALTVTQNGGGDIQQWYAGANQMWKMTGSGFFIGERPLRCKTGSAGWVGLEVQGSGGQGADLSQWKNASATVLTAIDKDGIHILASKTPASASDTGSAGMFAWDANYLYICTAANTWKRVAVATW